MSEKKSKAKTIILVIVLIVGGICAVPCLATLALPSIIKTMEKEKATQESLNGDAPGEEAADPSATDPEAVDLEAYPEPEADPEPE